MSDLTGSACGRQDATRWPALGKIELTRLNTHARNRTMRDFAKKKGSKGGKGGKGC